jgi:hypothetical protein
MLRNRIQFENDGGDVRSSRVLCKNSNERTLQSFGREAFVAELRLIAEHFSHDFRRANFLIIKEAEKT